jgi:hypothetical protein
VPVCWEIIERDAAAGRCLVYSVRTLAAGAQHGQLFAAEQELASAGCEVHLVTAQYAKPSKILFLRHTKEQGVHSYASYKAMTRSEALEPFNGPVELLENTRCAWRILLDEQPVRQIAGKVHVRQKSCPP